MAKTHNQLLIDMLMRLSGEVAKVDGIGGTRDWLIAELSTVISHAQDGPYERVFTESEVWAIIARLPVQAMVGTPCVMLEDIAPAFGLSDPA